VSGELGRLSSAVHRALTDASVNSEPAAELALTYAARVDLDHELLGELGPKLLVCLDALLLTPKARAAVKAVTNAGPTASPLDELRARRAARQRDTAALDAPAS
jgi:hypothetical protein